MHVALFPNNIVGASLNWGWIISSTNMPYHGPEPNIIATCFMQQQNLGVVGESTNNSLLHRSPWNCGTTIYEHINSLRFVIMRIK